MKTLIICSSALLLSFAGNSQENNGQNITSGKIIYEERVKLDIKLEGDAAQYAETLPKEQVSNKVLLFNSEYSLYQAEESRKSEDPMSHQTNNMTVRMIVSGANDKTFSDLKNKKKTEQKEFMTRTFLIESDLINPDWKFTGANRNVLGYNCQEAVRQDKDRKISAWFTPSIPVSTGPAGFEGLPGLVLMVDIDNGKRITTATSIDPSFNDEGLIARPKEGKKVTQDEFKKIVDEKLKEMGSEAGEGGAHVMIRIKN